MAGPGRLREFLRRVRKVVAPRAPRDPLGARVEGVRERLDTVRSYDGMRRAPLPAVRHVIAGRERDNFTYDISNRAELARFLAASIAIPEDDARTYLGELDSDVELAAELRGLLAGRPGRKSVMPFGRRLGWYAIVRARRPGVVIETGVHDGLGSTAILAALERNAREGNGGELLSFDLNPKAGWLVPERLRSRNRFVVGNSLTAIPEVVGARSVDVFIHDSDHRYEHEWAEFEAVMGHAAPDIVLLSDNAHVTTALEDFAATRQLHFAFWHEQPLGHFYPGSGIGIATYPAASLRSSATASS